MSGTTFFSTSPSTCRCQRVVRCPYRLVWYAQPHRAARDRFARRAARAEGQVAASRLSIWVHIFCWHLVCGVVEHTWARVDRFNLPPPHPHAAAAARRPSPPDTPALSTHSVPHNAMCKVHNTWPSITSPSQPSAGLAKSSIPHRCSRSSRPTTPRSDGQPATTSGAQAQHMHMCSMCICMSMYIDKRKCRRVRSGSTSGTVAKPCQLTLSIFQP